MPTVSSDRAPEIDEEKEHLAEGTLLSHLVELRSRLLKISAAVVGVFVCLLPFSKHIYEIVSAPMVEVLPSGKMIATEVASSLLAPFKLTFFVALFIAMPVVLYQIWAFVAPGLYMKEKRFAFPMLASSIVLFYAGVAFATRSRERLDAAIEFIAGMVKRSDTWVLGGHVPAYKPVFDSQKYQDLKPQSNYASAANNVVYDPLAWYSGSGSNFETVAGSAFQSVSRAR